MARGMHRRTKESKRKTAVQNKYLALDIALAVLSFSLFGVLRPDYVIIVSFFLIILYLSFTRRFVLVYHLFLAVVFAAVWVVFAREIYVYNREFLTFMGVNLYPLFSWSAGLFAVYIIYIQHRFIKERWGFVRHFILFSIFYIILLLVVETIAYKYFNIRIVSASYPPISFCGCLHAPLWMKVVYFVIGPLFFAAAYMLGLERRHITEFLKK